MARATGSINYLEHRTPLKDESGKYQIHPMFVKRDIVDQEKMEKRVRDHCAMNVSSFISALETLEDETLYALADGNEVRVGDMFIVKPKLGVVKHKDKEGNEWKKTYHEGDLIPANEVAVCGLEIQPTKEFLERLKRRSNGCSRQYWNVKFAPKEADQEFADKRKVFDNAELAEMMTDCGSFAPDEAGVRDATVNDLDATTIKQFLGNRFERVLEKKGLTGDAFNEASLDAICSAIAKGHDCEKILRNLRFIRPDGTLTVAAMLLFGKYTQRWMPMMTAKCICFAGNSIGGKVFRDKVNDADMEGNLLHQYDTIMDFFTRNLHNVQVGDEFNSMGKLEIPYTSLVEFTVNSLVHRSLNMKAPVRIFIFDNRVEIHSPGALPNGLTIDDIKAGTSMPRNMFLFNNAIYLLPYTGVGSGITRALDEGVNVTFMNNDKAQEFVITVWREESNEVEKKSNQVEGKSNQVGNQVEQKSNEVEEKSNQVQDSDTRLRHSDTKKVSLSNKQRDIVNFCSVPRTTAEIMERLGLSNQTKNRERYITSLVAAGYLQMTNPDNPTASNQKYKKVNKR
jgi:ATP-dependent DNA helicase RecG